MKNFVLLISVCASLLVACSENGAPLVEEPGLTFRIEANNPFSFSTRSAPIYSSDALQNIDDVFVYVFRSTDNGTTYKYLRTFDLTSEWTRGSNSVIHPIPKSEMLENGMYRFLAVGMDATTDYTIPTMVAGTTDYTSVAATLGSTAPEELFSGLTDYTIGSSIEVIRVLMHRRVAGVLGYFTNVPASIGGVPVRYLRLAVAGSNTVVDITSNPNAGVLPTPASGPGYNIFNIDLTTQGTQNGIYTGTMVGGGVGQLANTTLVGAYVIPAGFSTGVTMTLSLVGSDGVTALRSWPVRDDGGNTTFNIRSNHFYSLGRKLQSANTNNGTPDNTDDDDLPIDFQSQTLVANIASGWDVTHQMGLQEPPVN